MDQADNLRLRIVARTTAPPPAVVPAREALRLIDSEPVLDSELLALGRWISGYYCAPLGEVLRSMLPLAADIRRGKIWALTDAGRDATHRGDIRIRSWSDDTAAVCR